MAGSWHYEADDPRVFLEFREAPPAEHGGGAYRRPAPKMIYPFRSVPDSSEALLSPRLRIFLERFLRHYPR